MASIDPSSLIPNPEEHKGVLEIKKFFNHPFDVNYKIPDVSIFQVPETITAKKPEAYEPQQIGLGPNHHFRAQLYTKMEQKKIVTGRKFLQDNKINSDHKQAVYNKVQKLVPIIRFCYDMVLQGDDDYLASIFAIDGLFLINQFHDYNSTKEKGMKTYLSFLKEEQPKIEIKRRLLVQDIMMVENQIPFMVLKEINEGLFPSSDKFSPSVFRVFCKIHSPLILCKRSEAASTVGHLLHYMYYSIIHNVTVGYHIPEESEEDESEEEESKEENGRKFPSKILGYLPTWLRFLRIESRDSNFNIESEEEESEEDQPTDENHVEAKEEKSEEGQPTDHESHKKDQPDHDSHKEAQEKECAEVSDKPMAIMCYDMPEVHKEQIAEGYGETLSVLESFSQSKILIPSTTKLINQKLGFKFYSLPKDGGIQDIYEEEKDIYLPRLTLNNDSEVILRNLVAYETLTDDPDNFPLSEYVRLMSALIVNVDDVKYLRKQGVIKGDMSDDEVAKMFIEMSTFIPTMNTKEKSNLQKTIDDINEIYNSRLEMKIYMFLKKLAHSLLMVLKAVGPFVESASKIIAFMIFIAWAFIVTWQAFCNVTGCDKTTFTLLPYVSS